MGKIMNKKALKKNQIPHLVLAVSICMTLIFPDRGIGSTASGNTKSSNIKYIDISISQPGVEECMGTNVPGHNIDTDWINVYPNPNPGQFTVELQLHDGSNSLVIQLFDLTGKIVFESTELSNGTNLKKDLDVSQLENGVYFLQLTGKEKVGVKQIIIN